MLCQERPWIVFLLGATLIGFWGLRLLVVHDGVLDILFNERPPSDLTEAAFVQQAMAVEFPTPIDYAPIRAVCARTRFRPGLLFTCEDQHGGIGMVRNQILKCVRYAISGGGAVVVPSMALRNAKDITDIETATTVPLDYLLDRQTFVTHLTAACPGMRVYDRAEDFPGYDRRVRKPLSLVGDQFEPDHPVTGLRYPRSWRRFFDLWLERQAVEVKPEAPVHVRLEQSFLEYPVRADGVAFANEFGKILSFRNDTREVAAKVLWALRRRFALAGLDPGRAINPGQYYGAHLRLEEDAERAWPPDEWRYSGMAAQFGAQFRNLQRHAGLDVAYVASGNRTVVDLFAADLDRRFGEEAASSRLFFGRKKRKVAVVTKHDLLRGEDLRRLDAMTFDQQALVDFLVMFRASAFMGVAHSSFPWNIALRRHELSRYAAYANEGSDLLRDEYSEIMGMAADYPHVDPFVYGIWP